MTAAELFVDLLGAYAVLGGLFAIAFVITGVDRVDPIARGSGVAFRIIIFPGAALLWPLLLRRWMEKRG